MRILVDRKIKIFFCKILLYILTFIILSIFFMSSEVQYKEIYMLISPLGMGIAVLISCYRYFKEQNEIMENAVSQIGEYISGNRTIRIDCDEEGELYRLFHEVNSLVSILNSHVENERKAKEFLKNTISDISHQLKTPLAALNIYNGLLKSEIQEQPEIQQLVTMSEQELDRIETLVQNLLKIAKLDADTIVFERSNVNLQDLMNDIEMYFTYRAKEEKKELILSGLNTISLYCDRDWMFEAIINIVKNAFDHSQSGDYIYIEWKKFASVTQISVKDNGSGIHPEDLNHIFKRFYRSRFSKDCQGIGLGLSLAKAIIEAHNGTIEVDSKLGLGTTFVINFLNPTKL